MQMKLLLITLREKRKKKLFTALYFSNQENVSHVAYHKTCFTHSPNSSIELQ